ncbi:tetratricopeptide repeat protein [Pseudokordiimonas caeni]|uniref:tetratricopeptide repeat protein n=1 Tax=Pseudokordiimonas caeni TaxID=2997908 RepID=UPI002810D013|nr:tetratricopeptide repeat protein [Pseudokordiimonas caeni]
MMKAVFFPMAGRASVLAVSLLVAACAGGSRPELAPAPATPPLYSEFTVDDDMGATDSGFGPFLSATLAQENSENAAAAAFYLEALALDPSSAFVAERAFYQLLFSGRLDDAAALAAELPPEQDDNIVFMMRVVSAYRAADWVRLRSLLTEGEDDGFDLVLNPVLKAWSYAAEKDLVQAEATLAPLLADERIKPIAEEHLAYILDYMGEEARAEEIYKRLTTDERPVSMQPFVAYAQQQIELGNRDAARMILTDATQRFRGNGYLMREAMRLSRIGAPSQTAATPLGGASLLLFRLGSEFAQARTAQAAVVYLRLASYLTPEVADIYLLLGALFEQVNRPQDAAQAFATVPRGDPLWRVAQARRIAALKAAGEVDKAEAILKDMLVEAPGDRGYLTSLGDLKREASAFEEAIVYYSQVIDTITAPVPADWFVFFARGICYEQLGLWLEAETDLMLAHKLNPEEPNVLNYLGYSWIDRGQNIDEAKAMIAKAVEARPDDGFIKDSMGWVYYLTGDYAQAVETLEQAVGMEPTDATINDHLGDAYWRAGRQAEARFQWRHALDAKPDDDLKAKLLEKLEKGLPAIPKPDTGKP